MTQWKKEQNHMILQKKKWIGISTVGNNKSFYMKNITILNTYMVKSIQLAIIQAFTAPWEIKFEQMVVILNFCQQMENNDNIHHECTYSVCKSWLANDLISLL